ncbi:hypothetical protein BO70DRAFT_389230 [Aspergillus heteromorphus CBS 117.55]|uniref:Uncharacterized protein n=1 Tax=Aspergillus heteromorphus CBS 117.55 TaxID=1448321 RepID=A0A317VEV2_9EURO|nr:uncharacterized protein BO70DRAFT_389230 [Aspergillus heteromorphus CBS 117.55]PWY72903.1 hypothetical protein BO70DRAFT_389230 [Aspergillus heteromorphus CBS 117.55]
MALARNPQTADSSWRLVDRFSLGSIRVYPRPDRQLTRPPSSPLDDSSPRSRPPDSMNLRHRGTARSATFAEGTTNFPGQRRNSNFSDSVSEARNSIRSSTDDILFPRAAKSNDVHSTNEESHWHSAPLGLALLPAIAGIFFQNGSAVVTDVTLLVLAAIFLNWSVRLPWDWYRSAQAVRLADSYFDATDLPLDSETEDHLSAQKPQDHETGPENQHFSENAAAVAASRELQLHELAALASCFILPLIGTWLLHTIRSKLSRPSEGLVSNYNLTIFLLASEIRPVSHLLKLVQARTLHLQRIVVSSSEDETKRVDASKVIDLAKRLEELEAHVAETAAARLSASNQPQARSSAQDREITRSTITEVRKAFQSDIDALNRAVRRYEKRTAVSAYQTDSRLQALETKMHDALSLAVAAHHTSAQRPRGLVDWFLAAMWIPIQLTISTVCLPMQVAGACRNYLKALFLSFFSKEAPSSIHTKGKTVQDNPRSQKRSKRTEDAIDPPRGLNPIQESN